MGEQMKLSKGMLLAKHQDTSWHPTNSSSLPNSQAVYGQKSPWNYNRQARPCWSSTYSLNMIILTHNSVSSIFAVSSFCFLIFNSIYLLTILDIQKIRNTSWTCMSSLCRGHINLLCIVSILVYVQPKWGLLFPHFGTRYKNWHLRIML